jgi:outer membrane protein OmpA-like peptidoglycan-associated protein
VVSQGIDRSRITGKGYGETVLLNECADGVNCTEAQHSINRRTEMKVICPEKK